MLLRDVMYSLETGELQNLSIIDPDTGKFKEGSIDRIISSCNLAVTDLHTRFLLKKGTCVVTLTEGQVVYPLQRRFLVREPSKPEQFITGADDLGQLLKVLEVRDDKQRILPLNNGDPRRGIETPSFNTLNVSTDLFKEWGTRYLTVEYQKNGRLICTNDEDYDPDLVEVDLDAHYMHALNLFVASRLHNPSGFGTGGVHEGNNYHGLYLEECARLQNTGQQIAETFYGSHKQRRGFP